jgi:hypothetical protein
MHVIHACLLATFFVFFSSNKPIYASSNAVKDIIIHETPQVNNKLAFCCQTTHIIYPNNVYIPHYAFHIDLRNYTKSGFFDIGSESGDPYRVFTIN